MSFTKQVVLPKLQRCGPLGHQLVLLWLVVFAQLAFASPAHAQRVALLIGNSSYQSAPLTNPPNDVRVMEAALKRIGFRVQKVLNANQNQMKRAVRDFGEAAQGSEVALLYYSGHGTQASGENYLLPVGAVINKESDYEVEAVAANALMRQIAGARPKAAIVVLDACRDNPYASATKSTNKGLARMEAPTGTMIAFATSPGTTAGDEGYYAKVLAEQITIPGQELIQVFRNTGNQVRKLSKGKQEPRISEVSINDEVYLAGHRQAARLQPESVPQPVVRTHAHAQPAHPTAIVAGQSFKDCAQCPEMVVIPAGSFLMGSNAYESEKPPHVVDIKAFAIGKFEVTQGQWISIMGSNPSKFISCGNDCPVEQVSWSDIQQYIQKLNEKSGLRFRLPSESEWEYAARAGTKTNFHWGDNVGADNANCDGCGSRWDKQSTAPVGQFGQNSYGLYDMHGNVWEWVEDLYHENYTGAPSDGSAWTLGDTQLSHVLRGGAWDYKPSFLISSSRYLVSPFIRNVVFGFRVARALP